MFKITPSGTLTTVYSFCSQPRCADGYFPTAALIQGTDGNLYGTTDGNGSTSSGGTVFRISPNGTLTTIYHFCSVGTNCADGNYPAGGVIEGNDGNLYGTTARGGTGAACPSTYTYGCGTVFKLSSGQLTTLHSFCNQANCADGLAPRAALVQGADGTFYGSTASGGANCSLNPSACGTLFNITPSGTFTQLLSFNGVGNGSDPEAAMVQGVDGNLYGTTAGLPGTVFSVTPGGTLTTLHVFTGGDGYAPQSTLIQAGDGNFYGTSTSGGAGTSTLFEIASNGTFTALYTFCSLANCADGSQPLAGMIQAIDGNLYGTTYSGGANQLGTIFRFTGPTATGGQFVSVPPCRLADTRQSNPIHAGTWQVFNVPQLALNPNCNFVIPSNATAYSLNVTVVPPQHPLQYLTIWPAGRAQPFVSTMNSTDGRTKANAAIVPAGAADSVSVYVTDTTDVILDINGYFVPAISQSLKFIPLPTPCRVVDTRDPSKPPMLGPPALAGMETRTLPILSSPCFQGISVQPQVYSLNVTVTPNPGNQPLYFLALWPSGTLPTVSTLNNPTMTAVANAAMVAADPDTGDINIYASNSTDVIIDVDGYFGTPGEYSYYPAPPCRAFDSRNNNGQPFSGTLTVAIASSPCAPPSGAEAYVFNATVVPTSGALGYLTLWPDNSGLGQPYVSTLNAYDGLVTSNLAVVGNVDGSTDAYASNPTQMILDILGYFAP